MSISGLILAKNEQGMIEEAIKQLEFVDEIIVLDKGSTDKTLEIANRYATKVLNTKIDDFDKNRDLLATNAKSDWLLYVDPDERLSRENVSEIKTAIKKGTHSAYYFPRNNFILGKLLKHGGFSPDYVPRLFRKKNLLGWKGAVHESPKIRGTFGYFKHPITHNTARNMSMMLAKSKKWAKVEAQLYFKAQNPKVTIARIIKFSLFEFLTRYFLKMGFLDGKVGFISALFQALHRVMILTYLWELQNDAENAFRQINFNKKP